MGLQRPTPQEPPCRLSRTDCHLFLAVVLSEREFGLAAPLDIRPETPLCFVCFVSTPPAVLLFAAVKPRRWFGCCGLLELTRIRSPGPERPMTPLPFVVEVERRRRPAVGFPYRRSGRRPVAHWPLSFPVASCLLKSHRQMQATKRAGACRGRLLTKGSCPVSCCCSPVAVVASVAACWSRKSQTQRQADAGDTTDSRSCVGRQLIVNAEGCLWNCCGPGSSLTLAGGAVIAVGSNRPDLAVTRWFTGDLMANELSTDA